MQFYIAPGRENTETKTFHVVSDPGELYLGTEPRHSETGRSSECPSFV